MLKWQTVYQTSSSVGRKACNAEHCFSVVAALGLAGGSDCQRRTRWLGDRHCHTVGRSCVVVEYKGDTYRYDEATGTDLGDYTDPRKRFVQGCIRVTHDELPLTVFFGADRGTNRAEAVFELGRLWSKARPPICMPTR